MAFHHAVLGKDWDLMDQLWSENIPTMLMGDVGLLDETLAMLPAAVLATRPSMQVFREYLPVACADTDADGRRASARAFADACARLVRVHWDTMSLSELLVVATGYMIQLRMLGRFQDSAAFGDRVNARASALAGDPAGRQEQVRVVLMCKEASLSRLLHDDAGAIRSYQRAWDFGTGAGVDFVRSQAAANLALTYVMGGDTVKGRRVAGTSPRPRHFDVARRPRDRHRRPRGCRVPGPRAAR